MTSKVRLPGGQLGRMIEKVIFAVTPDDSRFALNGALLILGAKSMSLVASDGFRLAHVTERIEKGADEEERTLVPRKALGEIARVAAAGGEDVFYCRKDNHLFFDIGRTHLSSRVLEGTFPNFEKVIPKGNDKSVEFACPELTTALSRVSLLANERSRAIKLALKGGRAEISSRNPEMGEASETIGTEYGGDDVEIGFNAKYLLDFLAVVGTERVTIELKDEVSQGVLHPAGDDAPRYTYVVMPMRI
jgi:DNA polymerase-3 subunit beta